MRLPGELERFKGLPMRVVFAEVAVAGTPAADKARPRLWRTGQPLQGACGGAKVVRPVVL